MNALQTNHQPRAWATSFGDEGSPEIVNWDDILELRSLQQRGKPDLILERISTFLVETRRHMSHLELGRSMGDMEVVATEADAIKSSASSVSASQLRADAAAVEHTAEVFGDLDPLIVQLRMTLIEVQDELHRGLAQYVRN